MNKKYLNLKLLTAVFIMIAFSLDISSVFARGSRRVVTGSGNSGKAGSMSLYAPLATTPTITESEEEEDSSEISAEEDYKSSNGRRAVKKCAARYCEGYGNPYGKCFNTASAYSLLSSTCEDEMEETGHGTRALYDFLEDMNRSFVSACGSINPDFNNEEIYSGGKGKATAYRNKYLYKKTRINSSEKDLAVTEWSYELSERLRRGNPNGTSECADLSFPEGELPSYVVGDIYCINLQGIAVKPETESGQVNCPISHPTKQIYSAGSNYTECKKKMTVYETDGYYKYERIAEYRDTSGKCPVYIGYGPLQNGTGGFSAGQYFAKEFQIGKGTSLMCSRDNFEVSEEAMTYKVLLKEDGAAMSAVINGSVDVLVGGISAATAGVKKGEVRQKAYLEGNMCDKMARMKEGTSAITCHKNNYKCFKKDGTPLKKCGVLNTNNITNLLKDYWTDEPGYEDCAKKYKNGKFKRPLKKIYLYTQDECSAAGGNWISKDMSYAGRKGTEEKNILDAKGQLYGDSSKCSDDSAAGGNLLAKMYEAEGKFNKAMSENNYDETNSEVKEALKEYDGTAMAYNNCLKTHSGSRGRYAEKKGDYSYLENEEWEKNNPTGFDSDDIGNDIMLSKEQCKDMDGWDFVRGVVMTRAHGFNITCTNKSQSEFEMLAQRFSGLCADRAEKVFTENNGDFVGIKNSYEECMNGSGAGQKEMQAQMRSMRSMLTAYQNKYQEDMTKLRAAQAELKKIEGEKAGYASNIEDSREVRSTGLNNALQGSLKITQGVLMNSQNKELIEGKCVITNKDSSAVEGVIANEGEKIRLEYDMF